MTFLLRLLAKLPLKTNHAIGSGLGLLAYLFSHNFSQLTYDNLQQSGLGPNEKSFRELLSQNISETGKGLTELIVAWFRPENEVANLVVEYDGWEHVEAARKIGKGIIFITPHLGCYDIAGRWLDSKIPTKFLYRAPKMAWVQKLMDAGRDRGKEKMVPADVSGVRTLMKTLKQGGNISILPDQVPGVGEGVWADFFGRPAYTMTLVTRLQNATQAPVIYYFAERLPQGRGYKVWLQPAMAPYSDDRNTAARQLNAALEDLIRKAPAQYLWGYNRYKTPAGVAAPEIAAEKKSS
ncbi:MAG: lysophospholipid acyltransferase family protein [Burkholderiales bacterium]